MERIIKTVKTRKKRETFPEPGYNSLRRRNHIPGNLEQDYHELENYHEHTKLPQFTIDDLNQREISEKRRNFSITRSKSFALPVGHQQPFNLYASSYSSLSRKSSFSSILGTTDSLNNRSIRTRGSSDMQLGMEKQQIDCWHVKDNLYQVAFNHL